jgi:hypothetical protein
MSGAILALEAAVLARLEADADVKALLGEPPRVFDAALARPAHPYLELARHELRPAGGAAAEADEHRLDIAIVSREGGRDELKAALDAVRAALRGTPPAMTGWRCVLLLPLFADVTPARFGLWRALLRIKAVVEPA